MTDQRQSLASQFAEQAAALTQTLKPGTYEAAQALAMVSIAASLAQLADTLAERWGTAAS